MTIDNWFPVLEKIIECEFKTLEYLKRDGFKYPQLNRLASDANNYYPYYKLPKKKCLFNFESQFEIRIGDKEGLAHIGCLLDKSNDKVVQRLTHMFAILEKKEDKYKILRKFHFDYQPMIGTDTEDQNSSKKKKKRQPHSIFHLQYAGRLSPQLEKMVLDDSHMDCWLSEPRIFFSPMSLAILINLVLKEFPHEKTNKLIESSEWRNLVKNNEELVLRPFFNQCHTFFQKNNEKKLFLNDFYYGH